MFQYSTIANILKLFNIVDFVVFLMKKKCCSLIMKIIEDVSNGNHGVDSRIREISKAWQLVACEYEICFDFICL